MFKMWWIRLILFLYLLAASAQDLKSKTVSLPLAVLAGIAAGALHMGEKENILTWAAGCVPGLLLAAFAYVTRQSVGYGDGCIVMVIGLFLGYSAAAGLLMTALLLLCPVSLFFLVWKRNRKYTLPLAPFLFAAYVLWLIFTDGKDRIG